MTSDVRGGRGGQAWGKMPLKGGLVHGEDLTYACIFCRCSWMGLKYV